MEITIYRRHSADCPDRADRYAARCGCLLWGEFNWTQSQTALDGKKLRQGQNKWPLKTRTKAEALRHAAKLENDLEALLEGKPVRQKSITVTESNDVASQGEHAPSRSPRATFPHMIFPDDPTLARQRHNDRMRSIDALYSNLAIPIVAGLLLAFSIGYLVRVRAH